MSFAAETKENKDAVGGQEIPEEIYADYDSFESDDSWDDCGNKDGGDAVGHRRRVPYPCENRDLPAPPSQQNVYGFVPLVKRAGHRMKKRWSLGSLGLNRIRKLGGNLTATDLVGESAATAASVANYNVTRVCSQATGRRTTALRTRSTTRL